MSIAFFSFGFIFPFNTTAAIAFSVCNGVGGCFGVLLLRWIKRSASLLGFSPLAC